MHLKAFILSLALSSSVYAESFSASHFGFGMETNKLYNFKQVGGSMFLLDWGKIVGKRFSWGLKTLANGAHQNGISLFRLTSGPAVHYRWPKIELHYSLGYFQETVRQESLGNSNASSSGISQFLSIQRYFKIKKNVDLGWGSYLSLSNGHIDSSSSKSGEHIQQLRWFSNKNYQSRNQGIYASLRVSL
jgi:hypothetical protein